MSSSEEDNNFHEVESTPDEDEDFRSPLVERSAPPLYNNSEKLTILESVPTSRCVTPPPKSGNDSQTPVRQSRDRAQRKSAGGLNKRPVPPPLPKMSVSQDIPAEIASPQLNYQFKGLTTPTAVPFPNLSKMSTGSIGGKVESYIGNNLLLLTNFDALQKQNQGDPNSPAFVSPPQTTDGSPSQRTFFPDNTQDFFNFIPDLSMPPPSSAPAPPLAQNDPTSVNTSFDPHSLLPPFGDASFESNLFDRVLPLQPVFPKTQPQFPPMVMASSHEYGMTPFLPPPMLYYHGAGAPYPMPFSSQPSTLFHPNYFDSLSTQMNTLNISHETIIPCQSNGGASSFNGNFKLVTPNRPSFGTAGDVINLCINQFPIIFRHSNMQIHHYDVNIKPSGCPRRVNRFIFNIMMRHHNPMARIEESAVYDGDRNMYCMYAFHQSVSLSHYVNVRIPGQYNGQAEKEFEVTLTYIGVVSFDELIKSLQPKLNDTLSMSRFIGSTFNSNVESQKLVIKKSLNALDVILRHHSSMRWVPVGRSFFRQPTESHTFHYLGGGREVWFGHHQSLQQAPQRMLLNIDVSATAFYRDMPVIEFMCEVLDIRQSQQLHSYANVNRILTDALRARFSREIRNLKIEVTHVPNSKRRYRVIGLTRRTAATQTFPLVQDDGSTIEVTVQKYFHDRYQYELEFVHLPCLQVGQEHKHTYLPMEVCRLLSGQRCMRKLSEHQTSTMIKATARSATERQSEIDQLVNSIDFDNDKYIAHYGIEVNQQMLVACGRVLHAPMLIYGSSYRSDGSKLELGQPQLCITNPERGVWDMRHKLMYRGVHIQHWAICVFATIDNIQESTLRHFVHSFNRISNELGMPIQNDPFFCKYAQGVEQVRPMFECIQRQQPNVQLIICILPGKTGCYPEIKRVGDTLVGVATQCIQVKNVLRTSAQILSNVCLKINAKLGGTNTVVAEKSRPLMFNQPILIVGISLAQPPPGDPKKPAIAAMAASQDSYPWQYCAKVRVQYAQRTVDAVTGAVAEHRNDYVAYLHDMLRELLQQYYQTTNMKPARIIIYRDCIISKDVQEVVQREILLAREACRMLQTDYTPAITYITVNKRHHTRFFCTDRRQSQGRAGNVPAGTCVDSAITHPSEYDFYLCSHTGIQGTSRPCHYQVLHDDHPVSVDDLQQLSYMLCHTYARCTRSVSVPAPIYYAQLVMHRARQHLLDLQDCHNVQEYEHNAQNYHPAATDMRRLTTDANVARNSIKVHPKMRNLMYFT